ncbi:uncharacterized protein FIBRA_02436 [Fibroporia radiculosa]|uniref:DUF1279 domain-containing protein n=1 Tax=Fibroporia radiculosa TaxID=599839 RepID=J4I922_9APHY|nr:uncharacterized protein FIBRA_02436 [Fibroporia radiculosa]CCM00406.1 predicted protein [Fibroporia radiculosa]
MVRSLILRVPLIRSLLPRVTQPVLPLAVRLTSPHPTASLTRPLAHPGTRFFHLPSPRLASSTPSPSDQHSPGLPPNATLSQRLKHLIKAYGWYALGVYIFLTALDFTVAFAGINLIGAEHVSRVTAAVKDYAAGFIHSRPPEPGREEIDDITAHPGASGQGDLYTMLVLAYTVHKTLFFPIRVGLTATLTPRLVRWLTARGWTGGAGAKRAAKEVRDKIRSSRDQV